MIFVRRRTPGDKYRAAAAADRLQNGAVPVRSAGARPALGSGQARSGAECEHEARSNQQNAEGNERQRDQYSRERTADAPT